MKTLAKYLRNTFRLLIIEIRQLFVNVKYLGFVFSNKATIKWRMMLLSHSLEKGISLCDSRIDFGKRKAKDLFELIKKQKYLVIIIVLSSMKHVVYYKHIKIIEIEIN